MGYTILVMLTIRVNENKLGLPKLIFGKFEIE